MHTYNKSWFDHSHTHMSPTMLVWCCCRSLYMAWAQASLAQSSKSQVLDVFLADYAEDAMRVEVSCDLLHCRSGMDAARLCLPKCAMPCHAMPCKSALCSASSWPAVASWNRSCGHQRDGK